MNVENQANSLFFQYSRKETEVMKTLMNRRDENRTTTMPRTKLAKRRNQQWMKKMDKGEDVDEELVEAVDRFFKASLQ